MALPKINITTDLVRSTLNETNNNVGLLCKSNNINKWSKWKPISCSDILITDDILKKNNFGLIPKTLPSNITTSTVPELWSYNKPVGGINSPFRLGDFRGYNHEAAPSVYMSDVDWNQEAVAALNLLFIPSIKWGEGSSEGLNINTSNAEIFLKDFRGINFGDYYIGLAMIFNDGYIYYCFSDKTISKASASDSLIVRISISAEGDTSYNTALTKLNAMTNNAKVKCIPFLSSSKSATGNKYSFPLGDVIYLTKKAAVSLIEGAICRTLNISGVGNGTMMGTSSTAIATLTKPASLNNSGTVSLSVNMGLCEMNMYNTQLTLEIGGVNLGINTITVGGTNYTNYLFKNANEYATFTTKASTELHNVLYNMSKGQGSFTVKLKRSSVIILQDSFRFNLV